MNLCDCIQKFDLSEGITIEELKRHSKLADTIYHVKIQPKDDGYDYIDKDKLITILFKAIQELKNEIDILKAK